MPSGLQTSLGVPRLSSPSAGSVQAPAESRKACGLAGGRAAKREAQGARPRERGRDAGGGGEAGARAHAPGRGRAGGRAGAGRRGEGGKRAPWSPAESREGVDAEGAGPGEAGTRSRAGKAGARRWRERARSPPLFPTLPSTSDRPELRSGSARRSPEPPPAFLRPRRARQSPHKALLHLGHGWVSAGWPLGGCAGLVSFRRRVPPRPGSRARRRLAEERPGAEPDGRDPGGAGGPSAAVSASCARRPPPTPPSRPPLAASGRSREAETSRGRGAGPASPHFLSENGARRWRGRRLRRPRRSGSCCLPAGWGARRSFPRRRARASGDSRLGGDRVSNRDPVRVSGPAGSPDLAL